MAAAIGEKRAQLGHDTRAQRTRITERLLPVFGFECDEEGIEAIADHTPS